QATSRAKEKNQLGSLLLWVALAHVPLGLMAPLKVGGGLNSLHTLPYLAAWLALLAGQTWENFREGSASYRPHLTLAALWLLSFGVALDHARSFRSVWQLDRTQEK